MKDLDEQAYEVVCGWHKIVEFNPVYNGIDYSHIIRFYLWDKVGRSLRLKNKIDFGEVKVYKEEYKSFPFYYTPLFSKGNFRRFFFKRNKKKIFIPFQVPHTEKLISKLKENKSCRIFSKQLTSKLSKKDVIKSVKVKLDENWSASLFTAVMKAFQVLGLKLIVEDEKLLQEQIKGSVLITDLAMWELKKYKPDALYVHSDNHPPYINYILVAKQLGIPTFTYQHGLDCEHYFLDDCFADYIGVWTENRKKKYELQSKFKPQKIEVIGNIFINKPSLEKKRHLIKNLLFITRPHRPIKCYSPSRNFLEGNDILQTILDYLKKQTNINLYIKPHPMDFIEIYKESIINAGLEERVFISKEKIQDLFEIADVIITEDSTGGAEAMYYNLPCIHAHFANSNPIIPLVEYGCALSGYNEKELRENLELIFNLTSIEKESFEKRQNEFLQEFIPLGNIEDLANFITKNI